MVQQRNREEGYSAGRTDASRHLNQRWFLQVPAWYAHRLPHRRRSNSCQKFSIVCWVLTAAYGCAVVHRADPLRVHQESNFFWITVVQALDTFTVDVPLAATVCHLDIFR